MGFFYNKMLRESSAIQDPDDVGVDLDAIENNIMGDDGIEAHRDEVEDAATGLIGDPVEEASMIMYESEYNFNQLMQAIGVTELREACAGRDFFLEAENKKSFFQSCKETLKKMFEKITEVFHKVLNWFKETFNYRKKFFESNEQLIRSGFAMSDKWSLEMYDMFMLSGSETKSYENRAQVEKIMSSAFETIEKLKTSNATKNEEDMSICDPERILRAVSGDSGISNIKQLKNTLESKTFKLVTYGKNGIKPADNMFNIIKNALTSNKDIDELKDRHKQLKKDYATYMKEIARFERAVDAPDDRKIGNMGAVSSATVKYMAAVRFERNVYNIIFANTLKAYKLRRAQAFKCVTRWAAAAKFDKGDKSEKPKNESAFMNIDII